MTKQELIEMVEALPDETPSESLDIVASALEDIRFRASVERGLRQEEEGKVTPHDEFVARFQRRFGN